MRAALPFILLLTASGVLRAEDTSPVRSASFAIQGLSVPLQAPDPGFDYTAHLAEVRALGATHVLLPIDVYQRDVTSLPLRDPQVGIPDPVLLRTIESAKGFNLAVILMPRLQLSRGSGSRGWRESLSPEAGWPAWFEAWERIVLHYARLASQAEVEVLSLGAGLTSAERHLASWRRLIGRTRTVFGGALTYAAEAERCEVVEFWGDLDYVGLTGHWRLASEETPDPELEALTGAWGPARTRLLAWRKSARLSAPLLFLEMGWPSLEGCALEPGDPASVDVSTAAQQRCYEAFARAWKGTPELMGVVFREWWGEGGSSDPGYTPRGKPAEQVLRRLFGVEAPPPPPTPREGVNPDLTPAGRAPPR